MKSSAAFLGVSLFSVVLAGSAVAQPSPQPPSPATPSPPPQASTPSASDSRTAAPGPAASDERAGLPDNQIADQVDAQIARLKADLRLTSDQDNDWSRLQSTLHDYGVDQVKRRMEQMSWREDQRRGRDREEQRRGDREGNNGAAAMAQMRREADDLSARSNDLRKLADAAEPLYNTLSEPQQRELLRFFRVGFERFR